MIYISNAFSLQMTGDEEAHTEKITKKCARAFIFPFDNSKQSYRYDAAESCIGHQDICNLINNEIGCKYSVNRQNISLKKGDILIVAQYVGERLPEGTTSLPGNARIDWYQVSIIDREKKEKEKREKERAEKLYWAVRDFLEGDDKFFEKIAKIYPSLSEENLE